MVACCLVNELRGRNRSDERESLNGREGDEDAGDDTNSIMMCLVCHLFSYLHLADSRGLRGIREPESLLHDVLLSGVDDKEIGMSD